MRYKELESVSQTFPVQTFDNYKEAVQLLQESDVTQIPAHLLVR